VTFLLPLLILAIAGLGVYTVEHHRTQHATGIVDAPAAVAVQRTPFWTTTIAGKFAIGAFALSFLPVVFVNLIAAVPRPGRVAGCIRALGHRAFVKHDHSTSVLIAFAVSALAVLAGMLFLAGEVLIGHDSRTPLERPSTSTRLDELHDRATTRQVITGLNAPDDAAPPAAKCWRSRRCLATALSRR
jgi:hypothetical protein